MYPVQFIKSVRFCHTTSWNMSPQIPLHTVTYIYPIKYFFLIHHYHMRSYLRPNQAGAGLLEKNGFNEAQSAPLIDI